MRYLTAEISLIGDREQNQDRVATTLRESEALMVAVDGMGGHAEGEKAAEVAVRSMSRTFREAPAPIKDPLDFLESLVRRAHEEVVDLGDGLSLDNKPRATCAICLVQGARAYWAHVGDARVYLVREGQLVARTRDHSHVEILLQEGLITEAEVHGHPMRHLVECCLGGESALPDEEFTSAHDLADGDLLLVCSDGLWSGSEDDELAADSTARSPEAWLDHLGKRALEVNGPFSDNATGAALRVVMD